MTPSPEVDAYIAALPDEKRVAMAALRETINAAAPDAVETIAYKMPALRRGGRFLVSYDAYKAHYSLFPASDAVVAGLGDELAPYLTGKGTISFPVDQPLPIDLVRRIVEVRVAEDTARGR
jgi:uncharacterized protein YdhG (YjbR/CyaY superfamily)